ncbi:YfhD family protein [Metabacillus lacus]|uniref:YfhD family protein n=1 Tax=Metabacillus lacus TaxID=1983721 RepID=UPI0012B04D26|nr:YfhD family protein [Metabacillus lacus]
MAKDRKAKLPQVPENQKIQPDGIDEEFSKELADHDDVEAQARASAADERVKGE